MWRVFRWAQKQQHIRSHALIIVDEYSTVPSENQDYVRMCVRPLFFLTVESSRTVHKVLYIIHQIGHMSYE
jgi:hypothetical protein